MRQGAAAGVDDVRTVHEAAGVAVLDAFAPFHLRLNAQGRVLRSGPSMEKVLRSCAVQPGLRVNVTKVFLLFHGGSEVSNWASLWQSVQKNPGRSVNLAWRLDPEILFNATLISGGKTMLVNLGVARGLVKAMTLFGLTDSDFPATDMALAFAELEAAKTEALAAERRLNRRLQGAQSATLDLALSDPLTGLGNRRALRRSLRRLCRSEGDFAVLHLDLDGFKAVNDRFGHATGDYVLSQIATALANEVRQADLVTRFGGDEFVILIHGQSDFAVLERLADRLIDVVEQPIHRNGQTCRVSASIGIARSVDYTRLDPSQLLEDADAALYRSKRMGRAQHQFHLIEGGRGQ